MNSLKVRPDIGTLNAILLTITSSGGMSQTKTFALRVVAEFKELGIKPSLASYYHILNIFSRERNCRITLKSSYFKLFGYTCRYNKEWNFGGNCV
jgi:Pentatricopeptide repeat domain